MLRVGNHFETFDELSQRLEEFQKVERVQLWVRDSRTVIAAAKRARRKSLNPALKYAELTYSCVFGGRRPSDQSKVHNQTSAGGCPFKVRLSTSGDGQSLVVKEICQNHNHEPGKKLHDEPRRLYKKTHSSRVAHADTAAETAAARISSGAAAGKNNAAGATTNKAASLASNNNNALRKPIKLIVSKNRLNNAGSPFANLQQHNSQQQHHSSLQHHAQSSSLLHHQVQQQQQQNHHHLPLKLQLHTPVQHHHCYIKKEEPDQLTEVDVGCTPERGTTPEHIVNVDMSFPYCTPITTPGNSSKSSSAANSPNTSPTNSFWALEPEIFNMPPSPISPSVSTPSPLDKEEELLEPLYDLQEALEDGLSFLPSFDSVDLPVVPAVKAHNPTKSTSSIGNQELSTTTTSTNTTFVPLHAARSLTLPPNTIKVGYPASNCTTAFTSVYKPKTATSTSGNIIINTDTGLVKSIKANHFTNYFPSLQYNVVSNKGVTTAPKSVGGGGKITIGNIQQLLASNVSCVAVTSVNQTSANVAARCCSSAILPSTTGGGSPVIVAAGGISCGGGIAKTTVAASGAGGLGGGAIRNFRAKIAKSPYPNASSGGAFTSGSILKVVRSADVKPTEQFDRLINSRIPNNGASILEIAAKIKHEASGLKYEALPLNTITSSLKMEPDMDTESSDMFYFDNLYSPKVEGGEHLAGESNYASTTVMDQVISGGLKTEQIDEDEAYNTVTTPLENSSDEVNTSLDGSVIGGGDDTLEANGLDKDLDALFVLDGLEAFDGDIPITPESLFNVADFENYDVQLF